MNRTSLALLLLCASFSPFSKADFITLEPDQFQVWSATYGVDVMRVLVSVPVENPASCPDSDSYIVGTHLDRDVRNRIYIALLMSKALQRSIKLWVDTDACSLDRPRLLHAIFE